MAIDTYDTNSKLNIAHDDLEKARFLKNTKNKIAVRIGNDEDAPLFVDSNSNIFQKILNSVDRNTKFTYADAGTCNERIIKIEYSSATVYPFLVAAKNITYTLVGNKYILETIDKALEPVHN